MKKQKASRTFQLVITVLLNAHLLLPPQQTSGLTAPV